MNNKLSKIGVLLLVACFSATGLRAQDDFGIWTSVGASKKFANGLTLGAEGEMRTRDDSKEIDRWAAGLDVSYKPFTFLKLGVGYTYIYNHVASEESVKYGFTSNKGYPKKTEKSIPSFWQSRHRFNADVTGSWKLGRLTLSLRERYQFTYRSSSDSIVTKTKYVYNKLGDDTYPYTDDNLREGPEKETDYVKSSRRNVLRSRLQVAYNIRKCKLNPYASVEMYNSLNDAFHTDKVRWTLGTEYKLTKKNTFEFYYRYLHDTDDDDANRHVLGIGYNYKF